MTDNTQVPPGPNPQKRQWLPRLQSRWWTAVLCLSLMLNLLVGGAIIGHRMAGGPMERLSGASYVQLIPRRFFAELPSARRRELMDIVGRNREDLRGLRKTSEEASLKLADALDQPSFDIANVKSAVDGFATGSESLAARGGAIVVEIVSLLTPEERASLAQAIRDRADRGNRRKQ